MLGKFIQRIGIYIFLWTTALVFFTFLREFGQKVETDYEPLRLYQQIQMHLILGVIAGTLFGIIQIVFDRYIFKKVSFGLSLFLGSTGYFLAIFSLISLAILLFSRILKEELHINLYKDFLFAKQIIPITIYCFLVASVINFISEINKRMGPGNLRKMLSGKFYSPKQEERIFMFLDLRSSTSIAENLGHIKYSELIQDCFVDISVVGNYKAEIYQYVGDEAVLTWETEKGLKKNRCLEAFWSFQKKINSRKEYYLEKYNMVPEFKAGMHLGIITVAEVGEIKREIAYHGDTINTASRIQDECNILAKDFLISEEISAHLTQTGKFKLQFEGNIQLKGKTKAAKIFSVSRI